MVLSAPAGADEVVLANGDRISGRIVKLGEGVLTIETPYAKTVEIEWSSVTGIGTDTPAEIVLKDGTHLKGNAQIVPAGGIRVITETVGPVEVADLGRVKAINPPAAITYTGDAQAAASLASGNTRTVNGNLSGKFVARSERQRLTLRALTNYGEDKDKPDGERLITQNSSGSIKYDFFATKKLYTYVNSLLEHDKFQDVSLRSTIGAGLGYQFLEEKTRKLAFELGVSYFDANYYEAEDEGYPSGRWALDCSYQLIPDKIALYHFHEGYFGFERLEDLYIKTEQGVRFTVLKDFFTSLQANVNFRNVPSPGFKKTDATFLFGLGYQFDL